MTQIGLDTMSTGVLPSSGSGGNTKPQLIRFMAKANSTQNGYVMEHQYWYRSTALRTAQNNFITAVAQYSSANKVANSPWAYYKLVNVQAQPFDKNQIVADPTSKYNVATFYQANIVVETDYALQNFNGGQPVNGAPSDYNRNTTPPQFGVKNVYLFPPAATPALSVNMGGCMGCHGVAQSIQGSDFSFIRAESGTIRFPETGAAALTEELAQRYRSLFVHP